MSKTYKTAAIAQVQATKLSKKFDRVYMVVDMQPGYTVQIDSEATQEAAEEAEAAEFEVASSMTGWDEVDTSVNEIEDAAEPSTALALIPGEPRKDLVVTAAPKADRKMVTMTFPLTTVSTTYLGAMHEGKEVWFDKKSLISFDLDMDAKLATLTMARSKAVRRKLVAAA